MADDKKNIEDYGVIYLTGEINATSVKEVASHIIRMNIKNEFENIKLIINSPGGEIPDCFTLIDLIEATRIPVHTIGLGEICSAGFLIFITGAKGHRNITPNTMILSHRYSYGTHGNHSHLVATRKYEDLLHKRSIAHYIKHTNLKNKADVTKHLLKDTDVWLTAQEAIKFGIADKIERFIVK